MKKLTVHLLSPLIFIASMAMGILAAAGTSALIYGRDVTLTALGNPPYREHPAYILFLIPGMLIGMVGSLFGIIIPLNLWLRCPIDGNDKASRALLHRYANAIAAATTPDP